MVCILEQLEVQMEVPHAWTFTHVKRDGNRVANHLANVWEMVKIRRRVG